MGGVAIHSSSFLLTFVLLAPFFRTFPSSSFPSPSFSFFPLSVWPDLSFLPGMTISV